MKSGKISTDRYAIRNTKERTVYCVKESTMTDALPPKPIRASRISIAQLMQLEHANNLGNVHGDGTGE